GVRIPLLQLLRTAVAAVAAADASQVPAPLKAIRKLPYWIGNGVQMAQLFLMKPIRSEQFQPAVR
ncbi:MAG: magnesium-protoporphyrin IX monomethyl ester cyclase, partial [Cyanobium sp.]